MSPYSYPYSNEPPHDKTNKMTGAPSEDSDQLGHPSSLIRVFACAQWVAKGPMLLHADSEDSNHTGQMPRLIWVFAGRAGHFVGFVMLRLNCLVAGRSPSKEDQLSRLMTKPTKWHVRPAKTQISLGIRPVWSESSLSAWSKLGFLAIHWAHSEDSDQAGWMPRLIWVYAGRTCRCVGFVMRRLNTSVFVDL